MTSTQASSQVLRNYADAEPDTGKEWSTKLLIACYQAGAARIGWAARNRRLDAEKRVAP